MREIKFRQWVGGRFHYWGWGIDGANFTAPVTLAESKQYTGLVDKNDVEIYEGDVVEIPGYYNGIGVVIYAAPDFVIDDCKRGFCDEWHQEDWENNFEVVGNIQETPELIKAVRDSGQIVVRRCE